MARPNSETREFHAIGCQFVRKLVSMMALLRLLNLSKSTNRFAQICRCLFDLFMNLNLFVYITGAALCNRFAFAKLTDQPFIFLEFYYLDALNIALFSYILSLHLKFWAQENVGLGLLPVPTPELMYVHAYSM